jgi:3-oxoacyl-[acyl-carrier-protein] synthase II
MTCKTARVELPDIRSIDRRLDVHGMDKSGVLAACAARLALLEADVGGRASLRTDIGLFLHLASGSTAAEWEHIGVLLSNKFHLSQLTAFPYVVPNSITGNVCKALGLTGHNSTLCFGPGAGLLGLGISWNAMKSGHAHMLLSGSVDELLPFDKKYGLSRLRGGFENHIPGEGACMFMLETHSSAKQRGAPILGTICSFTYATESNASVSSKESAALLEHVVSQALIDAEILPKDIYAVSFSFNEPHQKQALDSALGHCRYKTYDVSGFLGNAAATLSSFNLAYCLLDSSIDTSGSKKYILSVLSSEGGARCAAIFAK